MTKGGSEKQISDSNETSRRHSAINIQQEEIKETVDQISDMNGKDE